MLRFSGAGVSDVGSVRDHNEDSAFVGPYLALVADGVGGAAAGEIASATVTYAVAATLAERHGHDLDLLVRTAVSTARHLLCEGVAADPARAGMASTLSLLACDGERVLLAHLGDSRIFVSRSGRLRQVTRDHTYVQDLVLAGDLTPAAARRHPWRNVITRSLNGDPFTPDPEPDLLELRLTPGDRILVCSDGLTDFVSDERIEEVLELADAHAAAAVLTQSALLAGGADNITCVVADVVESPRVVGDGRLLGAVSEVANVIDAAAVRR